MKTVLRQTKTVEKELFPKYGREVDHQTPWILWLWLEKQSAIETILDIIKKKTLF